MLRFFWQSASLFAPWVAACPEVPSFQDFLHAFTWLKVPIATAAAMPWGQCNCPWCLPLVFYRCSLQCSCFQYKDMVGIRGREAGHKTPWLVWSMPCKHYEVSKRPTHCSGRGLQAHTVARAHLRAAETTQASRACVSNSTLNFPLEIVLIIHNVYRGIWGT